VRADLDRRDETVVGVAGGICTSTIATSGL